MDGFHKINLFCLNIKCVSYVKQRGRQYHGQEYAAVQPRVVLHHLKAAPSDLFNGPPPPECSFLSSKAADTTLSLLVDCTDAHQYNG